MNSHSSKRERYLNAYARLRESEGRGAGGEDELLALPYLTAGPLARQWSVRSRTFNRFRAVVLHPLAKQRGRPLRLLDLGAGNGWLSYRVNREGHWAAALDLRGDNVDGLGAARPYRRHMASLFPRVAASFETLPFQGGRFDIVLFNASIHYAESLQSTLAEAARVAAPGGCVAILDTPFYARSETGEAMVTEKRRDTVARYPELAEDLLAVRSIEYLTRDRLSEAARPAGLTFRRSRVAYPFWYELRPWKALLKRSRAPSRFDLWSAVVE